MAVYLSDEGEALRGALDEDAAGSRAAFLRRALLHGGAIAAGGLVIGGLPRLALSAPSPAQDMRIFELVLSLEQLEAAFYAEALRRGIVRGELREFARVVGANEREHVAFVRKALGGAARAAPAFDFGETTGDPDRFALTAVALEDTAVAAYNGQATNLTRTALAAAAQIVSVEARHAAWMRAILGKPAAVDATDKPRTAAQVRADVAKTRFVRATQ